MRLFLAIEISEKIKINIESQLADFKLKEYPWLDWKNKDNYLINVFDFGEITDVVKLKKQIGDLLFDQEAFYLYATFCSVLIKHKIYLHINFRREKRLESLYQKLSINFKDANDGIKYEPTIDFAKGKVPSKQQYFVLKKKLEKIDIEAEVSVKKVTLFRIEVVDGATIVKKISSFKLI